MNLWLNDQAMMEESYPVRVFSGEDFLDDAVFGVYLFVKNKGHLSMCA